MLWNENLTGPHLKIAESNSQKIAVLAGPGTGKTSYGLVRRIMRFLQKDHVNPSQILFLTFTRTATDDFLNTLDKFKVENYKKIPVGTLHSFCLRMLMAEEVFKATKRPVDRILLDFEKNIMLKDMSIEFGELKDKRELLLGLTSGWANDPKDYPGNPKNDTERKFQQEVAKWLNQNKAILIGEVVPALYNYLSANPHSDLLKKYKHILVDEYQDLNKTEQSLIDLLAVNSNTLCVVGDDDQSIYGFKHAHPPGIVEFYESADEKISIDTCYRCLSLEMVYTPNFSTMFSSAYPASFRNIESNL